MDRLVLMELETCTILSIKVAKMLALLPSLVLAKSNIAQLPPEAAVAPFKDPDLSM